MKSSKFEWIPNEVLLEVFEYLSPADIFQGFYYLNKRYNEFLISLQLHMDLIDLSKRTYDYYNYFLFSLMSQRIISLRCEDIFDRLIYQIRLSDFISLKYLTIYNLQYVTLQKMIPQLNNLQNLLYLNLQTRIDSTMEDKIIFQGQLPLIQTCILNLNKQISFENQHPYSHLTYLTINQCSIEDICLFVHFYTPQLQYLTVTLINGKIPTLTNDICHLKSLVIHTSTVSFPNLQKSVLNSFSSLQRLTIYATDIDYANGKTWEVFISKYLRHLIQFRLHVIFPDDILPTLMSVVNYYKHLIYHIFVLEHETATNDRNIFENVKKLSLILTNSDENLRSEKVKFSNVEQIKLISYFREYQSFPKSLLVDISHVVRFSNLKSIEFLGEHFPTSSLVLFDYTPNLHSLSIRLNNFIKMTKMLTDQDVCRCLTKLIKHLTITSINNVKDLLLYERLPMVFVHLDSLSLSIVNLDDLYLMITLLLFKMAQILKIMNIHIDAHYNTQNLDQFMGWLIYYMYQRDLSYVDVKLSDNHLSFCF
ncbi:hypothetical protein I4U23_013283 [Adineta vaga]|nr:hypothetical protein I4U23_013283 [Adineta vaga]